MESLIFAPTSENPSEPKPKNRCNPEVPGNDGLVSTDQPSENQIPPYVETPAEGLEHLLGSKWTSTKDSHPPGKPDQCALRLDKKRL